MNKEVPNWLLDEDSRERKEVSYQCAIEHLRNGGEIEVACNDKKRTFNSISLDFIDYCGITLNQILNGKWFVVSQ